MGGLKASKFVRGGGREGGGEEEVNFFADDDEEHLMPAVHVSARSFPLLFTSVHNRLQTSARGISKHQLQTTPS